MIKTNLILTILAASAMLASAGAKDSPEKQAMGSGMSMMDMMGKTRGECMMTSDTLGGLLKTVQDAKKSDDKTKMKAALKRVEDHIAGMKSHMGQCMDMMGMMGKMMGGGMMGGGMMGGGMMSDGMKGIDSSKSAPGPVTPGSSDHKKHHPK